MSGYHIIRINVAVATVFALAGAAPAQVDSIWSRIYGGDDVDEFYDIITTPEGGYLAAGRQSTYSSLVKVDDNGQWMWGRFYGDEGSFRRVILSTDGCYLSLNQTGWMAKIDRDGNHVWVRGLHNLGGLSRNLNSFIATPDRNYLVVGGKIMWRDSDGLLAKINNEVQILWSQRLGDIAEDSFSNIVATQDGCFIVVGSTQSYGAGNADGWLIKVDVDGNEVWQNTYGGGETDSFLSVISTEENNYLAIGTTNSAGEGGYDGWLIMVDAQGNQEWANTFGGEDDDRFTSIIPIAGGEFLIVGETQSFGSDQSDGWLVKVDGDGNQIWQYTIGGENVDRFNTVISLPDDTYLAAGSTDEDAWLFKFRESDDATPPEYDLQPNAISLTVYPNPFNAQAKIYFTLPQPGLYSLDLMDLNGRIWSRLGEGWHSAGQGSLTLNASGLPAGWYGLQLNAPSGQTSRAVQVVK